MAAGSGASGPPEAVTLGDEDLDLLRLLAEGLPSEVTARRLAISTRTLRRRTRLVCDRVGVDEPIQAVVWAVRHDLL